MRDFLKDCGCAAAPTVADADKDESTSTAGAGAGAGAGADVDVNASSSAAASAKRHQGVMKPNAQGTAFTCPGFVRMYLRYVTWRATALQELTDDPRGFREKYAKAPRSRGKPKVLVVRTDWKGLGTGHMGRVDTPGCPLRYVV